MKATRIVLVLVLGFAVSTANARPANWSFFGDSITMGFLANTSILDRIRKKQLKTIKPNQIKYHIGKRLRPARPHSQLDQYNHPQLAWPQFLSEHFAEKHPDAEINVFNYAVSSSVTADLPKQIDEAEADPEYRRAPGPRTIFVWIGHNDLLSNRETVEEISERFLKEIKNAWQILADRYPDATVVILPVVDITDVYSALKNQSWTLVVNKRGKTREQNCRDSWLKHFPYGHFFPERGNEQKFVDEVKPKIRDMNRGVANWAQDLKSTKVHFLSDLFKNKKFLPEYFAEDCFHPSELGQDTIAQEVAERLEELGLDPFREG